MLVSLVVPAFNEEGNVLPFYDAAREAFSGSGLTCEIVYVDDGSSDHTFQMMKQCLGGPVGVKAVQLSRNFGKEAALLAGLEKAEGDVTVFIDCDLQQPLKVAREMVEALLGDPEIDCVAAYQENRKQGFVTNWLSRAFYSLLAGSSGMDVVADASDFRAFRSNVKAALLSVREYFRFSKGIFSWVGFKTMPFPYTPDSRLTGVTKWSFSKLARYAAGGLLSFTTLPLRLATYVGGFSFVAALVYLAVVVVQRLAFGIEVPGYATIVSLILLFGGLQLLVLGIMGEYLGRVYIEGKHRPVYVERAYYCDR